MSLITVVKPEYRYESCLVDCSPGLYLQLEMIDEGWRFYPLEIHRVCPTEPAVRIVAIAKHGDDNITLLFPTEVPESRGISINNHSWMTRQIITITWEEEEIDDDTEDEPVYSTNESSSDLRTTAHEQD